jgi:RNA polymerase sigma-70 factor, ECF subfamily
VSDDFRQRMVGFLPRLRRFTFALSGNASDADDIAQEACFRALAHENQWKPGTRFESWMFRIAQNVWIDRRRSQLARGPHHDMDAVHEPIGTDGREVTEGRLTLAAVLKGMDSLNEDQRALIALVCIEGASYKEAAETLMVPIGTVMSRLARARQALHAKLVPASGNGRFVKETTGG